MKELFQDALAVMQGVFEDASVAVTIGTKTGTGLRGTRTTEATLDGIGERGAASSIVRLSREDWPDQPGRGVDATIGGVACMVLQVRDDLAGAFWVVEYQEQQSAAGV